MCATLLHFGAGCCSLVKRMPPEDDDGGGPAAVHAASDAAHSSTQDHESLAKVVMKGGKAVAAELARKTVPAWCREVSMLLAKFQAQNREQIRSEWLLHAYGYWTID